MNIAELVRVFDHERDERVGNIKGAEVLRLRGDLLPLVRVGDALQLDADARDDDGPSSSAAPSNIVVVETGRARYGLIVDEMDDSEEIVVKPLGRHLSGCGSLAGATILGDGNIALILDVAGIAGLTELNVNEEIDMSDASSFAAESECESHKLLLFTNHPDEHFAVAMALVARIERFRSSDVQVVGDQEIVLYRGRSLPLLTVEKFISAKQRLESPHLNVIVFEAEGTEVGLVAPEIRDIREVPAIADTFTLQEPGVLGSTVIENQPTRLLDLYHLVKQAGLLESKPSRPQTQTSQHTLLLAEDSSFFRKQVKAFLQDAKYSVVEAEDGQVAWDLLERGEHDIHLVVTDIEMPNMNGFELCRRIKCSTNLAHLPVIALTSLAGEEDQRRGREVGVDDYQVKMNRDKLLASISEQLHHRVSPANQAISANSASFGSLV